MGGVEEAPSLVRLASLLFPGDPDRRGSFVGADPHWRLPRLRDPPDVLIWGRSPMPPATGLGRAMRSAALRETSLMRLKRDPPEDLVVRSVHRLAPPEWRRSFVRNVVRRMLLGGVLVELRKPAEVPRVLDVVTARAGVAGRVASFRAGSGGALLASVRLRDGPHAILRVARMGSAADPTRAAEGLEHVMDAAIPSAPRLLARGVDAGASWSLETIVPGRRPRRVSTALVRQLAGFCSGLPPARGSIAALDEDLATIGDGCPELRSDLDLIAGWMRSRLAHVPAVLRHGDLWAGNILVDRGVLSGVVDWGAWHEAGVPGADLLHLFATEEGARARRELGDLWRAMPWRSERFAEATAGYWRWLGLSPGPALLDAIGVAWWAAQVAGSLLRLPHLVTRDRWTTTNVRSVVDALRRQAAASR